MDNITLQEIPKQKKPKDLTQFRKVIINTTNLFVAYSFSKLYNEPDYCFLIVFDNKGYEVNFDSKSKKDSFIRKLKNNSEDENLEILRKLKIIPWDRTLGDHYIWE